MLHDGVSCISYSVPPSHLWKVLIVGRLLECYRRQQPAVYFITVKHYFPRNMTSIIYWPRRDGQLGYLQYICTYITCSELLRDKIQTAERELNSGPWVTDENEPTDEVFRCGEEKLQRKLHYCQIRVGHARLWKNNPWINQHKSELSLN